MNQDDLKKLKKVIKDELRSVKELVEITKKKVGGQELSLLSTSSNVRTIKEQISVMNEKLDEHSVILEKLTKTLSEHTDLLENQIRPSVITTETQIKIYADMYKVNNSNGKKPEKRIEVLKDQSGIIPPPEFTLVNTQ
ncbi:MAG: hypothetical protein Q7R97_03555 [Candidatus Daviesbacteria bacterium]|nr:hypothetical protein [Candidatus Daviesbacteria bacterium]